jgi:hypothetical protein
VSPSGLGRFYYYNHGQFPAGGFDHEGDWENIQVRLRSSWGEGEQTWIPEVATYSQHSARTVCDWSAVSKLNDHPGVFVANGRHGSYFDPGKTMNGDANDGEGPVVPRSVIPLGTDTPWIRWPGHWGETFPTQGGIWGKLDQSSPQGPAFHSQWTDPADWDNPLGSDGGANTGRCPDSTPARTSSLRRALNRRRSPTHGTGPVLSARRETRSLKLRWRRSTGVSARRLSAAVLQTGAALPARTYDVPVNAPHGTFTVRLPRSDGRYTLIGTWVLPHGRLSRETRIEVQ